MNSQEQDAIGNFNTELSLAKKLDAQDNLAKFRKEFHFPVTKAGEQELYLVGNSLGLQPGSTREFDQFRIGQMV